jgi:hypothetical protein
MKKKIVISRREMKKKIVISRREMKAEINREMIPPGPLAQQEDHGPLGEAKPRSPLFELERFDDRFGAWGQVTKLCGNDGLLGDAGLGQPALKLRHLLAAMPTPPNFFFSFATAHTGL